MWLEAGVALDPGTGHAATHEEGGGAGGRCRSAASTGAGARARCPGGGAERAGAAGTCAPGALRQDGVKVVQADGHRSAGGREQAIVGAEGEAADGAHLAAALREHLDGLLQARVLRTTPAAASNGDDAHGARALAATCAAAASAHHASRSCNRQQPQSTAARGRGNAWQAGKHAGLAASKGALVRERTVLAEAGASHVPPRLHGGADATWRTSVAHSISVPTSRRRSLSARPAPSPADGTVSSSRARPGPATPAPLPPRVSVASGRAGTVTAAR